MKDNSAKYFLCCILQSRIIKRQPIKNMMILSLSLAEKTGIVAFIAAVVLLSLGTWLYVIPLICFVLSCLIAPFIPQFGFFLPITSRSATSANKTVSLSFDDGPDPKSTPYILKLLDDYNIKATFFVVGSKAKQNQDLIRLIRNNGHSIGNHTYSHDSFLMLKGTSKLAHEIQKTQEILQQQGIIPIAFRPPVGITSPRLKNVLRDYGLFLVNFSHRSADMGNRFVHGLAERILKRIKPGAIIVLHDTCPKNPNELNNWLTEIEHLIIGIERKGLTIVPLEALIDKPVMRETEKR